ncbi:beta-ketoacyl-ACP synthase III [Allostreptomyces psammosilenae]|uniref:Beta-ketoacyl-[acyl-carrier-protein] synthase III n=1 Tax=Allostreptomyces psammosilenae TaxID=1892865 RepID=A0A853A1M5_9ACTN|nr:beta-ketoacyl-ACP synthase III [Allostreptomyces psammosilenae]NYI06814.1 3-oxoacyl-[acyl-carrier-protein] synthase-3 [Allostreptomyces psammosilenae]
MTGSRITAFGYHQPAGILTNQDLEGMVETNDEWIRQRVGIVTRHIAEESEQVVDLAVPAAEKALASSGLEPDDIDLVVVATCTQRDRSPNVAASVAARIGLRTPAAYDINTACSGFCYALATADHAISAGAARHALVIGAEKMTDVTDWTDRTTCVLVGDGAGAVVVSASDKPGIGPVLWGSEPEKGNAVRILGDWKPTFAQDGQTVYRWATHSLAPLARAAIEKAGYKPEDLAGVVTHQANLRIIEGLVKQLGVPQAVVAKDVVDSGNTSAASVPLALAKLAERGELPSGGPVLLFGFGGGLTYAGQVITMP